MGEKAAHCFKSCGCCCKSISIGFLLMAIIFIITGISLVVRNSCSNIEYNDVNSNDNVHDYLYSQCVSNCHTGIGLLIPGIILLILSLVASCCAFQLGIWKRCVQGRDARSQEVVEEQVMPPCPMETQAPYPPQMPYPTQAPPFPTTANQLPPNAGPTMGPRLFYKDVGAMPTAPPANPDFSKNTVN
ncbi:hypothetical protein Aperf_G00000093768 [Anoplocephala perfoliata]